MTPMVSNGGLKVKRSHSAMVAWCQLTQFKLHFGGRQIHKKILRLPYSLIWHPFLEVESIKKYSKCSYSIFLIISNGRKHFLFRNLETDLIAIGPDNSFQILSQQELTAYVLWKNLRVPFFTFNWIRPRSKTLWSHYYQIYKNYGRKFFCQKQLTEISFS